MSGYVCLTDGFAPEVNPRVVTFNDRLYMATVEERAMDTSLSCSPGMKAWYFRAEIPQSERVYLGTSIEWSVEVTSYATSFHLGPVQSESGVRPEPLKLDPCAIRYI